MRFGRKKRAPRGPSEAPAARIGLKPPGGGKLKWIRVGFAGTCSCCRRFWGFRCSCASCINGARRCWRCCCSGSCSAACSAAKPKTSPAWSLAAVFVLLDLFLGLYGNRLTARAYLRHGWTIDHPDYAATRKVMKRWKLEG